MRSTRRNRRFGWLVMLSFGVLSIAQGQNLALPQRPSILSKVPEGFSVVRTSADGGKLLLAGGPMGMFVAYPADGEEMPNFIATMKVTVSKMFFHEGAPGAWSATSLPSHTGVNETGQLFTAFDETRAVQLAVYVRVEGFAYGYFSMHHTNGDNRCIEGQFIDSFGSGSKAFDAFVASLRIARSDS